MRKLELEVRNAGMYPTIYSLTVDGYFIGPYIISSPFGNCQNFSINQVQNFIDLNFTEEEIRKFFILIKQSLGKSLFVIDVCSFKSKQILELFKFATKKVKSLSYTSTNGTKMILHLIQINYNKI